MANGHEQQKLMARAGPVERPQYKVGDYLAADDLLAEQGYRLQRMRRHNRFLHGWGVVCGLRVVPARQPARPWAVLICPGYTITCCGDEVEVYTPALLDIRDYVWARPVVGGKAAPVVYVGIRHVEEYIKPVSSRNASCDCEEAYHPSRICDGFQVDALWALPEFTGQPFDLCAGQPAPCPECGESPYVILARVTLPASEGELITVERIDNL